jgi:hypothetical protein
MKKNIILKLNDEVILFTKNIKWDISENKKHTYLIASNKPFFNFDKLLTFFIENELTNFTENQLNILLKNCNIFLSLNKEYNAIKTTKNGFTVHYIAEKNIKEYKGSFGDCKKLVWNTGKSLMDLNEDEFLRTYKIKNISIYCYNYFTLSLTIEKLVKLISDILTKEPQQIETNKPDKVKENIFKEIFSNGLGFTLFFELHNIYKNKINKQANYSFLFYALSEEYLVCNGTDFVNFLSKFEIDIDKIDSRQSGTNAKTSLFNSTLKRYLK